MLSFPMPSQVSWPLPAAPVPVKSPSAECHILGCNVHSSHMLLLDHQQSEAAGCHPAENQKKTDLKANTDAPPTFFNKMLDMLLLLCYKWHFALKTSWIAKT